MSSCSAAITALTQASNGMAKSFESWNKTKIQQAALEALAFLSASFAVAATVLTFTASPLFLCAAVPLFILAGMLLYFRTELYDYDDPTVLQKLQKQAEKMSFHDLVEKHGWKNIFKVLSPKQFEQSFVNYVEKFNFNKLIYSHKAVSKNIEIEKMQDRYHLPLLSKWKDKYVKEIADLSCTEIQNRYPVSFLQEQGVIGKEEYAFFERLEAANKEYKQKKADLSKNLQKESAHLRRERDDYIDFADYYYSDGYLRNQTISDRTRSCSSEIETARQAAVLSTYEAFKAYRAEEDKINSEYAAVRMQQETPA